MKEKKAVRQKKYLDACRKYITPGKELTILATYVTLGRAILRLKRRIKKLKAKIKSQSGLDNPARL